MSFGKRGNGEGHPARNPLPPQPADEAGEAPVARMKVTNPGAIDTGFIALAVGVVVVSAGVAIAVPSVFEMMRGVPVRPIEVVVAGLKRDEVKVALASEAFPDNDGRAFMTSLHTAFPKQHDVLLGALADRAMDGGDRDDLIQELNKWSMDFGPDQLKAISRTGSDGFDRLIGVFSEALVVVENSTGGCTVDSMRSFLENPTALSDLSAYGSEGYKTGMRSTRTLIELAHEGRDKGPVDTELTPDDVSALQATFFSLMMDKQVMTVFASMGGNNSFMAQQELSANFNVCQLGRTVAVKLKKLPQPTKGRLLAAVLSNMDPSSVGGIAGMGHSSFGQPMLGPPSFPSDWEPPGWDN